MIEFFKKNIISTVILILGLILIFAATSEKESKLDITTTNQEMLGILKGFEHLSQDQVRNGLSENNQYVFIDLRDEYDYEVGHIENAISIPTGFLLDEENISLYNELLESDKTIVLYGKTERESISPWILLYELGFTNTKILSGGYNCFIEKIEGCETESSRYNYAEIASQGGIKEVEVIKKKPPVKKKKAIPVQKKVKLEDEGGC